MASISRGGLSPDQEMGVWMEQKLPAGELLVLAEEDVDHGWSIGRPLPSRDALFLGATPPCPARPVKLVVHGVELDEAMDRACPLLRTQSGGLMGW